MPAGPQPNPLGRAPCDDCELAPHCKAHLEACAAFVAYVDGAREKEWRAVVREPQRRLYVSVLRRRVLPGALPG